MWAEWLKETRKRDLKLLFKFYLKYMENDTILIASKLKVDPVVTILLCKAWMLDVHACVFVCVRTRARLKMVFIFNFLILSS